MLALIVLFLLPLILFALKPTKIFLSAETQTTFYARAVGSNVKLYRSTQGGEETNNIYFIIPQTYFVLLFLLFGINTPYDSKKMKICQGVFKK